MSPGTPWTVLLVTALVLTAGCVNVVPDWPGGGASRGAAEPVDVTVTGPRATPSGDDARFEARAADVDVDHALWIWDFGDGATRKGVGLTEVTHAFTEAGAFNVTVTVVTGDGRRGGAFTLTGVSRTLAFEGSVTSVEALGPREYAATFRVLDDLTRVHVNATLARASPAPAGVEPAPDVILRVLAPGDDEVALEERVAVNADPTEVNLTVPGDAVARPGHATLEVVAEDGSARFHVTLTTAYA